MKKICIFLCVMMCFCLYTSGLAEKEIFSFSAVSTEFSARSGYMAIEDPETRMWGLYSPRGERLNNTEYDDADFDSEFDLFKVRIYGEDPVHNRGIVGLNGQTMVPCEYADLEIVSERWQLGIRLTLSEADNNDYTFTDLYTNEKLFYRIDSVDIFLDGAKIGAIGRNDYGGYATAYGSFVEIRDREKRHIFYDGGMNKHEAEYGGEFESAYSGGKTTYIHNPTGQQAFTPDCTLQPGDVKNAYVYDHGNVLDLQGNTVATSAQNYDTVSPFNNGYWRVRAFQKYGIADSSMNQAVPCEYDSVETSTDLGFGYVGVVRDGKFGYVDLSGNVTCDFVYSKDVTNDRGTFATIKDLDGSIIVLSAAAGELEEHFSDVDIRGYSGCMAIVVKNANGQTGVIGLNGSVLLPFSDVYRSVSVSRDGRFALVSYGNHAYSVFELDAMDLSASSGAVRQEEAAGWTCENGHTGNTGKFCTECGLPMPPEPTPEPAAENDGAWTCENGHTGNTGKFCSECGLPMPVPAEAEDDGTWTCENGHAGNTGKFCTECGAAKP